MKTTCVCVVLIHASGYVLGTTRRGKKDVWGLPGGKLDKGETLKDGILRELEEETGIKLSPKDLTQILNVVDDVGTKTATYFAEVDGAEYNPRQMENDIFVDWIPFNKLLTGAFPQYNEKVLNATCKHVAKRLKEQLLGVS